jgi:hypothetical protein
LTPRGFVRCARRRCENPRRHGGSVSPLVTLAARALSVLGHPVLLMPAAVAMGASGAGAPPRLLPVELGTAVTVVVIVGLYSLRQVRAGSWAHVDASQPSERRQFNLLLAVLPSGADVVLRALAQPPPVALAPLMAGLVVGLAHLLRHWYGRMSG